MTIQRPFRRIAGLAAVPVLAASLAWPVAAQQQQAAPARTGGATAAAPSTTPGAASTQATQGYRAVRASQLIGTEVHNRAGQHIGEITDLVVNMNTGDLRYAVMTFDPGILSAERLFAVPPDRLEYSADGRRVLYDVDRDQLERAAIERTRWTAAFLADDKQVAALDRAWNLRQPARGTVAHRVSDLLGKDVENRSGEDVGEIEELVVDLGARKVHYAVLAFDPGWLTAEKRYVFALGDFRLPRDPDELMLDVSRDTMRNLRGFEESRMDDLGDRNWVTEVRRNLKDSPVQRTPADTGPR